MRLTQLSTSFFVQSLILKSCRLYNTFGSGSTHGLYAQFMAQSIAHNNNRAIGLLRGAGNRMATFFYSLHRLLRLKPALLATVHTPKFAELTINRRIELAVYDIMNERFWQAITTSFVPSTRHFLLFVFVTQTGQAWIKFSTWSTEQRNP